MNRTIRIYPAFSEFYGMEETIERIVSFFRHAAQGLEERKQILYLLGPVGGGKSWVPSSGKRAAPGTPIDVPLGHKDAAYVRSHIAFYRKHHPWSAPLVRAWHRLGG